MQHKIASTRDSSAAVFLAITLLVFGTAFLFYRQQDIGQNTDGWITHTYQVTSHIEKLSNSIAAAALAQREYILTGDEKQQKIYSGYIDGKDENSIPVQANTIRTLTLDNPNQQKNADDLSQALAQLEGVWADDIKARQVKNAPGLEAADDNVNTVIQSMMSEEHRLLTERTIRSNKIDLQTDRYIYTGLTAFYILFLIFTGVHLFTRRKIEAERDRFLAIIEKAPDYIKIADVKGGIEYLNPGGRALLGIPEHYDVSRMRIPDMHPPLATKILLEQAIPTALKSDFWMGENILKHRDGHEIPVSQVILALRDKKGNPKWLATIARDITEIKNIERMKNEFVTIVSHELRTPLTSIRGALGLITGGVAGPLPPKMAELLDTANKNCERLGHLVGEILDMEKLNSGKLRVRVTALDLTSFLDEVIDTNDIYAEKYNVKFVVEKDKAAKTVLADSEKLMQVFSNLLSNAAKHSKPGDEVHIKAQLHNGLLRFSVQDFGPGIPKEFYPRVFQKFAQTEDVDTRSHQGSGLGLSIVKSLVEAMNGKVDFVSEIGNGTTFFFDLPVAAAAKLDSRLDKSLEQLSRLPIDEHDAEVTHVLNEIAGKAGAESRMTKNLRHILCIDDESDILSIAKTTLEDVGGYKVSTCTGGREALNHIAEIRPDMILLDAMMPEMDGLATYRLLRERGELAHIPIVFMTAKILPRDITTYIGIGATGVIVKPFDPMQLPNKVEALWRGTATWPLPDKEKSVI